MPYFTHKVPVTDSRQAPRKVGRVLWQEVSAAGAGCGRAQECGKTCALFGPLPSANGAILGVARPEVGRTCWEAQ